MNENEAAKSPWKRRFIILFIITVVLPVLAVVWLWQRFGGDVPVDHASPTEHFKYGSTGGEHEMGFPYWIWRALPEVCPQYLPGKGYQSLGMVFEKNADGSDRHLPIGTSQRRYQGIDRVFVNCAVCHTSTVRAAADQPPTIVLGMPAATFNMKGFEEFFFRCAADPKFSKEFILPEIERQGGQLDLLDRYVVYPLAIAIMRDRVLALAGRFDWVFKQHEWGPGRVDTFNSAKVIFNFPMAHLDPDEFDAPADFPSLWRQRQRKEPHQMQLHWDGNNTTVEERNKSAAFGTGTTPPTIDIERISRVEDWILDVSPPSFSQFFPVDAELALRGAPIYQAYCANCHGASGQRLQRRAGRQGDAAGRDRYRSAPARFLQLHTGGQPGDALRRLPLAVHPFSQDARLRQHAARRHLAARALPAQWLGAQPARPARTGGGTAAALLSRQRRL
jgi:mono/diheme cytochrome c family protein